MPARAVFAARGVVAQLPVALIALLLLAPVVLVLLSLLAPFGPLWQHLWDTVLGDYLLTTLQLVGLVALGVTLLGVSTAWLVSSCDFPGRRLFEWALVLPMAMPAYIIAYTYTGLLDYGGPLQQAFRHWMPGFPIGAFVPEVRNLGGAALMLSLVLYPYVYMLVRSAFLTQSSRLVEAARTLGCSHRHVFLRVALPLARPAVLAGVALAVMETLADYGTVKYFGVHTVSTGIFRVWYGFGDLLAATQLGAGLLGAVLLILLVSRLSPLATNVISARLVAADSPRYRLSSVGAGFAFVFCATIFLLGFGLPVAYLLAAVMLWGDLGANPQFLAVAWQTFYLAGGVAVLTTLVALVALLQLRTGRSRLTSLAVQAMESGYAVPGAVVAVGVLAITGWAFTHIAALAERLGSDEALWLGGTLATLMLACVVRFVAVALRAVRNGFAQISITLDEVARTHGYGTLSLLRRVHLPLLRNSLLASLLLVFVDVLKELPATLILRPFNFNTLAVHAFELASDERLLDAALPALTIVAVGLIPVILINRRISPSQESPA